MDRKAHWEKVYQEKAADTVSWYQQSPQLSLSMIGELALSNDAPIIDVGGGASLLVDCLLNEGYSNLSVLDISQAAIDLDRKRLAARANKVTWIAEDITLFKPSQTYQLWHDRAVFHFLTDSNDRLRYIEALLSATEPGSCVIVATFALDGPEKCSGLPIVQYDEEKICGVLGEEFKLANVKSEKHLTPWQSEQSFNYFKLIRK